MIMKNELISKRILLLMSVVALIVFATGAAAEEEENVSVGVNAPEFVSGTFDVTIDIYNVIDLYGGQFDLSFDPDVVNVNGVYEGEIDGTTVTIDTWGLVEGGRRVRVLFNIDDIENPEGVSGSGYLATIRFEVVGDDDDTIALELYEGLLSCYKTDDHPGSAGNAIEQETDADWSGDVVTVGDAGTVETEEITSTPVRTATPRSASPPSLDSGTEPVTASTPATEHVSDAAVPVETSEMDEQDVWSMLAEYNFTEIYSFIGLLAFIYTLTLLR